MGIESKKWQEVDYKAGSYMSMSKVLEEEGGAADPANVRATVPLRTLVMHVQSNFINLVREILGRMQGCAVLAFLGEACLEVPHAQGALGQIQWDD